MAPPFPHKLADNLPTFPLNVSCEPMYVGGATAVALRARQAPDDRRALQMAARPERDVDDPTVQIHLERPDWSVCPHGARQCAHLELCRHSEARPADDVLCMWRPDSHRGAPRGGDPSDELARSNEGN